MLDATLKFWDSQNMDVVGTVRLNETEELIAMVLLIATLYF